MSDDAVWFLEGVVEELTERLAELEKRLAAIERRHAALDEWRGEQSERL